jgi:DNA adenine methylase
VKSPLNYLGGKSRLAERIVKLIPEDHLCYCEPFCGAAWVLFSKKESKVEVINDADGELVVFWRVVQNHLDEFLRYYKWAVISRTIFTLEGRKDPSTLTDIQRAVRYFYLQKLGFGGKTFKRTFGYSATEPSHLGLATIQDRLLEVHWRLEKVTIEHLDAVDCIQRYDRPTTLFYVDPPYWSTAGYAIKWGEADFIRLRKALDKVQGRFLLSLNDHPEVRKLFAGFRIRSVSTSYSAANGRVRGGGRAQGRAEVIIDNLGTR